MSDFKTILYQKEGSIATITLNRPKAANGFNRTLCLELEEAILDCDYDKNIRCLFLPAQGKLFSAGGDLKAMATAKSPEDASKHLKIMANVMHSALSAIMRLNKPVVVAVNGMAAGAGFSLAMAGDIVIASEDAKFTMAYTAAGLVPDGGSTYMLPRLIGVRRTMDLMLSNKRLTAQEALDWNLINQIVPGEVLQTTALSYAKKLAAGPTDAYSEIKKLLLSSFSNNLETQMELEGKAICKQIGAANGQEGIKAFVEKRRPVFK
jgi:2-(1,2-epoxy-1,2-dihydrophenyl)acetyl-CoA isomerase